MKREGQFVVESFSGVILENLSIVPAEDGSALGLRIQPPTGDPVSVIVPAELMKDFEAAIARGVRECSQRQNPGNDNRFYID